MRPVDWNYRFIKPVADKTGFTCEDVARVMRVLIYTIGKQVESVPFGERVLVSGLGVFYKQTRKPPDQLKTGLKKPIATVKFYPEKNFRAMIQRQVPDVVPPLPPPAGPAANG